MSSENALTKKKKMTSSIFDDVIQHDDAILDMSQRSKRAIISKTKRNRCLESVLIDSWADFTHKVTSIRDSRVKFQIPGANMDVARACAYGPTEHKP